MRKEIDPARVTPALFLSGAFASLLGTLVFIFPAHPDSISDVIFVIVFFWVNGTVVTIPIALIVGVPGYFLLLKTGALNAPAVCLIGAMCGLTVHFIGFFFFNPSAWSCAAIGLASAFLAWLVLNGFGSPDMRERGRVIST